MAQPHSTAADHTPSFAGIDGPNYTPMPNVYLDDLMATLSGAEFKVLCYITRRTLGFGWAKTSDRISLTQICKGIVRRDGRRLDQGTGLSRPTAIKALHSLVARGVIAEDENYSDEHGYERATYGLIFRAGNPWLNDLPSQESPPVAPGQDASPGLGKEVDPQKKGSQNKGNNRGRSRPPRSGSPSSVPDYAAPEYRSGAAYAAGRYAVCAQCGTRPCCCG